MLGAGTVGTTLHLFLNPYWGGGYGRGLCPWHEEGCGRQSLGERGTAYRHYTVGDTWDPHVTCDRVHVMPGHSMHGMVMQGEDLCSSITLTPHTGHPNCRGVGTPLRYHSLWLPGVGESSWSPGRELALWGLWGEQVLVRGCVCKAMHARGHVCKGAYGHTWVCVYTGEHACAQACRPNVCEQGTRAHLHVCPPVSLGGRGSSERSGGSQPFSHPFTVPSVPGYPHPKV